MGTDLSENQIVGRCIYLYEQLIEESDDELIQLQNDDFANKAKMLPVTFVIKARKL